MKRILSLVIAVSSQLMANPDIIWTSPSTISSSGVDASSPKVVMDSAGNAVAVFLENGVVKSTSLPFGGSFGSISSISGSSSSFPKLNIDSSGNCIALFLEGSTVHFAELPFGGSWSASTAISSSNASNIHLSMDQTGNAVAIWQRNGYIESATKLAGMSWSLVNMLSSGGNERNPHVAIGENGTIIAVWSGNGSGQDNVYSAKGSIGGSWQSPINIISVAPAQHHNYPRVAVDANGNAVVVWFRYAQSGSIYSFVDLLSSTLDAGASAWTAIPSLLTSQSTIRNPQELQNNVYFDGQGNAIAMWTSSFDGETFNIETARKSRGSPWILGGSIALQNLYALNGSLSMIPSGDGVITYMYFDDTDRVIQSTETDLANPIPNFFSPPQTISSNPNNANPAVASSLNGSTINAITLWVTFDGSNNVIQAVTGSKSTLDPPTDLSVVENVYDFGVFQDYYKTISWTLSPDPSIVRYNIYRDGLFFASVDSSTSEFIDHNTVHNGAVTYGIAGASSDAEQSAIMNVSFP